jgi:hypothetical protein
MEKENSVWERRGFHRSVRVRIYNQTWEWNHDQGSIVEAICAQNPAVPIGEAIAAYNRFTDAALGDLEGTAAFGRGDRELQIDW